MLSTLLGMFGGQIVDKLFGTLGTIITNWQQKQITEIEAKRQILLAFQSAVKEIEITYAQELSKTYATMMGAVQSTPIVARVWACVTISQLIVILWAQLGIPFLAFAYREWWGVTDFRYPSAGTTIDWAYALLGGLVGLGAISLKNTGGSSAMADRLKSLMRK